MCTVTFVSETDGEHYVSVIAERTLEKLPGSEPGTVSGEWMFDGWYTEEGAFFDGTEPILKDTTVYSKSHRISGIE